MVDATCAVDGCEGRYKARGFCNQHYRRFLRSGTTDLIKPDAEERFWAKVEPTGCCWYWTGEIGANGYGRYAVKIDGKTAHYGAHRYAYELLVGPIGEGLTLDHLCNNPPCVNPDHLVPASMTDNTLRGHSPWAVNARKTHCVHGHPFSGENLIMDRQSPSNGGGIHRRCRACSRETSKRRAERDRQKRSNPAA